MAQVVGADVPRQLRTAAPRCPQYHLNTMFTNNIDVSLSNLFFDGGKAELAKGLSPNFQVSHSFTMATATQPATYHFGAVFVAGKHLLHGLFDTAGTFQGKYHYSFTSNLTAKLQAHIAKQQQQSMLQNELEYNGADYSVNVKAINPDLQDGSGIYTASWLQSVSKSVAFGGELIAQKAALGEPVDTGVNLVARWAAPPVALAIGDGTKPPGTPEPKSPSIFTVTLQQFVACQASYFHRVSEKVELAAEWQALLVGPRRDALTSVSAKFDYRQACIRTQLDSLGRVQLLYEERLFPGFSLLLSGELDHLKASGRFGVGINLEN